MQAKRPAKTLGRTLKAFSAPKFSARDFFFWFLPGVLIPLSFLAFGGYRVYLDLARIGRNLGAGQVWFLAAAICTVPAIWLMLRHVRRARQVVFLHPNGLRFQHVGKHLERLYWPQITGIAVRALRYHLLGRTLSERTRITLYPAAKASVEFPDGLVNGGELARHIKDNIYPRLRPQLLERLKAGQWLDFGPCRLNRDRLVCRGREIPWGQLKSLQVAAGTLVLEIGARGKIRIASHHIPNLELMLQIIAEEITP